MTTIWNPVRVGRMDLPHRLALAPMTRSRAEFNGVPGEHTPLNTTPSAPRWAC